MVYDKVAARSTPNASKCLQVPHLPRKTKVDVTKCHACHAKWRGAPGDKSGPSAPHSTMSATPATQNDGGCEFVPRLPRETKVDVTKCHACPAKWHGAPGDKSGPSAPHSTMSATPATQNDGTCEFVCVLCVFCCVCVSVCLCVVCVVCVCLCVCVCVVCCCVLLCGVLLCVCVCVVVCVLLCVCVCVVVCLCVLLCVCVFVCCCVCVFVCVCVVVCFVVLCVCVVVTEAAGGGGGGEGEARDTESKTRTPHKDVGKNNLHQPPPKKKHGNFPMFWDPQIRLSRLSKKLLSCT